MRLRTFVTLFVLMLVTVPCVRAQQQQQQSSRDATREKLRQLLATAGPKKEINIEFRQST